MVIEVRFILKILEGILKRIILVLVTLFSLLCSSLMAWELDRQCDFPTSLLGMEVEGNDVWVVGIGAVAKSTDNGNTFNFVDSPAYDAETGDFERVYNVSFKDSDNGVICGRYGFTAVTNDSGENWTEISGNPSEIMRDAAYLTTGQIWLVGNDATMMYSADDGVNWEQVSFEFTNSLYSISMDENGLGYVCGKNGTENIALLLKTTDFGATWTRITTEIEGNEDLYYVYHENDLVVLGGNNGYLGVSYDGAESFQTKSIDSITDDITAIEMNGSEGYALGDDGLMIKTTDNWETVESISSNYFLDLVLIGYNAEGELLSGGQYGNIVKTVDGAYWNYQTVSASDIFDISMIDENNWYLAGTKALVAKTTDGGNTFSRMTVPGFTGNFTAIHFSDANNGFVAGETSGTIYNTIDGGISWTELQVAGAGNISDFEFYNDNLGFAFGDANKCLRTNDGGETWEVLDNGPSTVTRCAFIKDENNILAGANNDGGNMWTSTDGGDSWSLFSLGVTTIYDITFKDENHGVAVAANGFVYYTSTGGMTAESWTVVPQITTGNITGAIVNQDDNFVISACNEDVQETSTGNVIFVSDDNGETWVTEEVPSPEFIDINPIGMEFINDMTVMFGQYQIVYSDYNPTVTETPAVFFSEYIEGSASNKAIEIYNGTDAEVDLTDFVVYGNYNGNAWSEVYPFEAGTVLASGDVYVMASDEADQAILDEADVAFAYGDPWYLTAFNGDDVRALAYVAGTDTTIIDVIGLYDLVDPGDGWAVAGIEDATKEHTLVRKSSILEGNADWIASAGTTAENSEWIVLDQNTFDYLGSHNLPLTEGTLSGTVTLADGEGVVTGVVITAGTTTVSPAPDGSYSTALSAGTYEVTATLAGYATFTQADVVISEDTVTTLDITLSEALVLNPPTNLAVDEETGMFTWAAPAGSADADFSDDFEGGDFANWGEVIEGTGTIGENGIPYWNVANPDFTYESLAAMVDWGYNIDTWLITNDISIEAGTSITFDWASNYAWHVSPFDNGDLFVKVSTDGGANWDTLWNYDDEPTWTNWVVYNTTLDLSSYAGQTVKIAFNAICNDGADNMLDNVVIGSSRNFGTVALTAPVYCDLMAKNAPQEVLSYLNTRDLTGYKVYLDGYEVAEVTGNSYQFTNLVYGTTYTPGVAAVYNEGVSEIIELPFLYNPPVDLDAPTNLAVDSATGEFNWAAPGSVVQGLTEGFETSVPPVNWTATVTNAASTWHQEGVISFSDGDISPQEGEFQAAVGWDYGAQDEWLITPAFEAGANLHFWSYSGAMGSTNLDHYYVKVSTDGGSTWEILWDAVTDSQSPSVWEDVNIDLSAYSGSIQLAWQAVDGDGAGLWFWWMLDDIAVTDVTGRVISFDGELQTRSNEVASITTTDAQFSRSGDVAATAITRDLTGYEVFLDGTSVANVTETNHTFTGLNIGQEYIAGVKAVYDNGTSDMSTVVFTFDPDSGDNNAVVAITELGSNYPNPFNPTTNISFSLKEAGKVSLDVYNAKGQKIRTLLNSEMAAANHVVTWNGDDNSGKKVSSGIYFYKMHTAKYTETKKMLLMK